MTGLLPLFGCSRAMRQTLTSGSLSRGNQAGRGKSEDQPHPPRQVSGRSVGRAKRLAWRSDPRYLAGVFPIHPRSSLRLAVFQALLNRMKQLFLPSSPSHVTRRWIGLAQEPQPIASIAHPVVGRDEMMPIPDIRLVNSLCHHVAPTSTDPFAPLGSRPP